VGSRAGLDTLDKIKIPFPYREYKQIYCFSSLHSTHYSLTAGWGVGAFVLARNANPLWKHYFCHHEQKAHHCTLYKSVHSTGTFRFSRSREKINKRNIYNSYLYEMGGACSVYGRGERCVQGFGGET
jgi:hypothetical protein